MKVSQRYSVELTPRIATAPQLPKSIEETHEFLKSAIPETRVALDDGAMTKAEGVLVRTTSRCSS